jgi:hypothetical protein
VGGIIAGVSIGNLAFAMANMGIVLSFYTEARSITPITAPYIYDAMGVVYWMSAALMCFVGTSILFTTSSKARAGLLTVWVALVVLHLGIVLAYGIHAVQRIRQLYLLHRDIFKLISAAGLWAIERFARPTAKLEQKVSQDGILFILAESVSAAGIIHAAPYPFNYLIFMGLRIDIAALFYVGMPGMFALLSIPLAMAVRNYFNSQDWAVMKHRERYEGEPLKSFMCGASDPDFEEFDEEEEDLASTFARSSSEGDEKDSLLGSSSEESDG